MSSEELEKAYAAQIKRKDAEIEELRKKNEVLIKTAIRQNEKLVDMQEMLKKIEMSEIALDAKFVASVRGKG